MSRRELDLQKRIRDAIVAAGGAARVVAQTGVTTVGDGDVYGVLCGCMLYIEVKDGDEYQLTKIQKHRLREWYDAGAIVCLPRTFEEMKEVIDAIISTDRALYGRARDHVANSDARAIRSGKGTARRKEQ